MWYTRRPKITCANPKISIRVKRKWRVLGKLGLVYRVIFAQLFTLNNSVRVFFPVKKKVLNYTVFETNVSKYCVWVCNSAHTVVYNRRGNRDKKSRGNDSASVIVLHFIKTTVYSYSNGIWLTHYNVLALGARRKNKTEKISYNQQQ